MPWTEEVLCQIDSQASGGMRAEPQALREKSEVAAANCLFCHVMVLT
jgi:hypothetical protein